MVVAAGDLAWRSLRLRGSPLTNADLQSGAGWLVLSPHPDDETLGAGGLIARLAAQGDPAWVAFVTAGEASHSGAAHWPLERIARTRKDEGRRALEALGHCHGRITHLGWRDGKPHLLGSPGFTHSSDFLTRLCRRRKIQNVVTTWRGESHCDHQAAFMLASHVVSRARGRLRLFEYLVWGWKNPALVREAREFDVLAVDASRMRQQRMAAMSRHRTQLSPVIRNAREAFRLPADIIGLATRDPLILLSARRRYAI